MKSERFTELFKEYSGDVKRVLNRNGVPAKDIDDIAQEMWIRLLRVPEDREIGSFPRYVRSCALRARLNWRAAKKNADFEPMDPLWEELTNPESITTADLALQSMELADLQKAIWKALDELSPRQKEVILLHHAHGMTLKQIAVRTNQTNRTVLRQLVFAHSKLRKNPALADFVT